MKASSLRLLNSRRQGDAARRLGTTVLELVAAAAILGVLLVVCTQMISRMAAQQRAVANRQAALQMASNAMERAYSLPWNELDETRADAIAKAMVEQSLLRRSDVAVVLESSDTSPAAKKIEVAVTWQEGSDGVIRKEQLTAWRFWQSPRDGGNSNSPEEPQP